MVQIKLHQVLEQTGTRAHTHTDTETEHVAQAMRSNAWTSALSSPVMAY